MIAEPPAEPYVATRAAGSPGRWRKNMMTDGNSKRPTRTVTFWLDVVGILGLLWLTGWAGPMLSSLYRDFGDCEHHTVCLGMLSLSPAIFSIPFASVLALFVHAQSGDATRLKQAMRVTMLILEILFAMVYIGIAYVPMSHMH